MSAAAEAPAAPRPGAPQRWPRLRLALLGLSLLFMVQLVTAFWLLSQRSADTGDGFRLPLPAQAAAIVNLLESAPVEQRPLVLSAVNSPDLRIHLLNEAQAAEAATQRDVRVLMAERALRRYLAAYENALPDRAVLAYFASDPADARLMFTARALLSSAPFRLDIALADGAWLRMETRGDATRRLFGWPLGLALGIFALALAGFALTVIWLETRPLAGLAWRLERFAVSPRPEPMREEGPGEVRGVIRAFNHLQTRVAALLAERAAMLGALGHDLRTYLTRMRLRAALIEDEIQREKAERDLAAMARVIEDALAYAAIDSEARQAEPLALDPILTEALETFDAAPPPQTGFIVMADAPGLLRVLDNLIGNALKHGGGFEVAAAREKEGDGEERIVIRVLDRGPGFPAGAEETLMRPFERGDAARTLDRPGAGLGLAIAAQILTALGGSLRLRNREGGGASAEILLRAA